jgi:hypothetical protein
VRRFDLLEQAVQRAGAKKILFGTDGPWLHPAVELAKVKALNLSPANERLILGENFLQLISHVRIDQRPRVSRSFTGWNVSAFMEQSERGDPGAGPSPVKITRFNSD